MTVTRSSVADRLVMECVIPGAISTTAGSAPETRYSSTGYGFPSASRPTRRRRTRASPETTRKRYHLEWCQWLPLVTPGLETFTDTCPRSGVRRNSVKEPRSSTFALSGYASDPAPW